MVVKYGLGKKNKIPSTVLLLFLEKTAEKKLRSLGIFFDMLFLFFFSISSLTIIATDEKVKVIIKKTAIDSLTSLVMFPWLNK